MCSEATFDLMCALSSFLSSDGLFPEIQQYLNETLNLSIKC